MLFGLTHDYTPTQAARWGNYLASAVVEIQGPRLEGSWADKFQEVVSSSN